MTRCKVKFDGRTIVEPDHMKDVRLLDLEEREGRYYFRFGNGDDFNAKLLALKAAFSWDERTYDPDKGHLWSVEATPENRAKLCAIFPNGEAAFGVMESQMRLF